MAGRLGDVVMQNCFLWMMVPGSVFEISGLAVRGGGLGIHQNYHLVFLRDSTVELKDEAFPTIRRALYSNYHVSWKTAPRTHFFGEIQNESYVVG